MDIQFFFQNYNKFGAKLAPFEKTFHRFVTKSTHFEKQFLKCGIFEIKLTHFENKNQSA